MRFPNKETVERLRREYPAGTRVELVQMDDSQAPPIGTKGTVEGVDDTGSLLMKWDNGSGLNVVCGKDIVKNSIPSPPFATARPRYGTAGRKLPTSSSEPSRGARERNANATPPSTPSWSPAKKSARMTYHNRHKIHKISPERLCSICSELTCYYPLLERICVLPKGKNNEITEVHTMNEKIAKQVSEMKSRPSGLKSR